MTEVTQLLLRIDAGDGGAAAELLPVVYEELRRLAGVQLAHEAVGHTLQATALVHEAYLRLVGGANPALWDHRGHFFAAAAESMRRILVDSARRRNALKRGGGLRRELLAEPTIVLSEPIEDLEALDVALTALAVLAPEKAKLVELRYFAGLTIEEAAAAQGISVATAKRYWAYARAWLFQRISGERPKSAGGMLEENSASP